MPGRAACCAFSWSGFYLGVNAGGGWNDGRSVDLFANSTTPVNLGDSVTQSRGTIGKFADDGFGFVGGQIGYNHQAGSLVFGVEADIQAANLHDQINNVRFSNPNGTFPIDGTARYDLDYFGTVRGRIGVAFHHMLVYATGGWAYGRIDYNVHAFEVGGGLLFESRLRSNNIESGYVVGGGVEYALGSHFSLKLEYQYINLGHLNVSAPVIRIVAPGIGTQTDIAHLGAIDSDFHTIRLGLNYKFGREPAPLK